VSLVSASQVRDTASHHVAESADGFRDKTMCLTSSKSRSAIQLLYLYVIEEHCYILARIITRMTESGEAPPSGQQADDNPHKLKRVFVATTGGMSVDVIAIVVYQSTIRC